MPSKKVLTKSLFLAHLSLLTATIIWAAAGPVIKVTLEYLPTFTFLLFRFLLVGLILLPFIILELRRNPIDSRDLINLFLLGLLGQSSIVFIFEGLKYTSALDSAIIGVLTPLMAIAAGHYFFKEKINKFVKTGVLVATLGSVVVALEPILNEGIFNQDTKIRLWGNFLVIVYNFSFLIYIIWSKISLGQTSPIIKKSLHFIHLKPMRKNYSTFLMIGTSFYVGLATMIPLALAENLGLFGPINLDIANLPPGPILGVLYMSLLSSIVAYMLFDWALNTHSMGDTAIYSYLAPIFTLPFAYVMISEIPTKFALIGSAVIAIGVIIAEHKKS